MSAVEERINILRENIPKLIKSLTGFETEEENYKRCEQFAWYTIKNHRNLSVNSHEIKRKIEGMQEKFMVENFKMYGDHLEKLCNSIINHPLCVNHYEVDIQWALIDFLFNLSYNPVGALRKNKDHISLDISEDIEEVIDNEQEYWTKELTAEFIESVETREIVELSDLSDWSDVSSEESSIQELQAVKSCIELDKASSSDFGLGMICEAGLEAPKKENNFQIFDTTISKYWLYQNCQNSWWLNVNANSDCKIPSNYENANFAHLWNNYLSETSNNYIKMEPISTGVEFCLLRELIWMFYSPVNCKFFVIDGDDINIRPYVTIPSVTTNGLSLYMSTSFIPHIKQYNVLRQFINSIYLCDLKPPPKTYECYTACLKDILHPFSVRLLKMEQIIQKQLPATITTLIQVQKEMRKDFQYLERVYEIHKIVILDIDKYPAHILSSNLLAGLLNCFRDASCVKIANLCITLFLASVQVFCNVIDTWWTEGRLEDYHNEFIIEKCSSDSEEIIIRPYQNSKTLNIPQYVQQNISDDNFLEIFRNHSLEADCTLNLLYKINKIGNLRSASTEGKLYESFIADIYLNIANYKSQFPPELKPQKSSLFDKLEPENYEKDTEYPVIKFLSECATVNDEFLLMAFAANLNIDEACKGMNENKDENTEPTTSKTESQTMKILEMLNDSSKIILPLEEIIMRSITRILSNRISFANNFVINMYRNEFEILKNLKNIRRVLLLESSDILYYFYRKIFVEIEDGKDWANPFLLTVQLDDIMSSRYPEVSSLFRVEINSSAICRTTKVIEAVDEITIFYNVRKELQNIITNESLAAYNRVFRFLLKVKWGLNTLEDLSFSKGQKNRLIYLKINIIDIYMRRLEQLRFWMLYAIQCIHFHLMTHVLHSMGDQLDKKINDSNNLTEIKSIHKSYIRTICEHCFLSDQSEDIRVGVEQLLSLIYVLRVEWKNCSNEINETLELSSESDGTEEEFHNTIDIEGYVKSSQIEAIENTYIKCHQYLAKSLNNEVYIKQNSFLSGLSAAFNTSIPY